MVCISSVHRQEMEKKDKLISATEQKTKSDYDNFYLFFAIEIVIHFELFFYSLAETSLYL